MDSMLFELQRLGIDDTNLSQLRVCSDSLVGCYGNTVLLFRQGGGDPDMVEISKKKELDNDIQRMFVDPSGHHIIMCLRNGDNYYLHTKGTKAKKISRLQGVIESIAFDKELSNESSIKSFLVGTSMGFIYEMSLDSSGKEKNCSVVYHLQEQIPITSIYFDKVTEGNATYTYVVLTTSHESVRVHYYIGDTSGGIAQLFTNKSKDKKEKKDIQMMMTELPGDIDRANIQFLSVNNNNKTSGGANKREFSLQMNQGIYIGSIVFQEIDTKGAAGMSIEVQLVPFSSSTHSIDDDAPLAIATTEYHFLMLMEDKLRAVSRLSGEVVQEELLRIMDGNPINIVKDVVKDRLWYYTDSAIFEITLSNESRHLWSIYLQKAVAGDERMFDLAYSHCSNNTEKAAVLEQHAEFALRVGKAEDAAIYFARCRAPFEETALRLLTNLGPLGANTGETVKHLCTASKVSKGSNILVASTHGAELNALRIYLCEALKQMPQDHKVQRTMVGTWLCEVFLHQISMIRIHIQDMQKEEPSFDGFVFPTPSSITACYGDDDIKQQEALESNLINQFKDFLRDNYQSLDRKTVYDLMSSRSDSIKSQVELFYARLVEDWEQVLAYYFINADYLAVLEVLATVSMAHLDDLFYRYVAIVTQHIPEQVVEMLRNRYDEGLDMHYLVPAFLQYDKALDDQKEKEKEGKKENTAVVIDKDKEGNFVHWGIDFLQDHSNRVERGGELAESSVYMALVTFLCKYDTPDEVELCILLKRLAEFHSQGPEVLDDAEINRGFILRTCKKFKRERAVIYAYTLFNQERKAVTLAVKLDLALAKSIAKGMSEESEDDVEYKEQVWLTIAMYLIAQYPDDPSHALAIIGESEDVLTIDKLLKFLPDITELDLIKQELVRWLEKSEDKLEDLRAEMVELSESGESVEDGLDTMKQRGFTVSSTQHCQHCSQRLFSKQFYLFPCSHAFHTDCLYAQAMTHYLDDSQKQTVKDLNGQLRNVSANNSANAASQIEQLQNEIDGYIAADCPLCGYAMIRSVALPLIGEEDMEEKQSWDLD